jgi:MoxR-like ATPase
MEEKQVSIGDQTLDLPEPFFVIATQNPIEQEGTFALPEAQRDRFIIKTSIGYPDYDGEQDLLDRRLGRMSSAPSVDQVVTAETPQTPQQVPEYVHVAPETRDYILTLGRATREHEAVEVGASPRGIQRFLEATRARAVIHGREYVIPEDVKTLANPVLAHRIVLRSVAVVEETAKSDIIDDVLEQTPVPAMDEQSAQP